jgi:hypothetical protein
MRGANELVRQGSIIMRVRMGSVSCAALVRVVGLVGSGGGGRARLRRGVNHDGIVLDHDPEWNIAKTAWVEVGSRESIRRDSADYRGRRQVGLRTRRPGIGPTRRPAVALFR